MRQTKKRTIILLILLIGFIAIQFIRPPITHPPVTGDIAVPQEVKKILQASCYDCHSNETHLKWFDEVAPAYWLVSAHVKDGRKALNFSNWDSLAPGAQKANLFLSVNQVLFKEMPRSDYTLLHPGAKLSEQDITVLKNYVGSLVPVIISDTSRFGAADRQYNGWIGNAGKSANDTIKPSLNGIGYPAGYNDWEVISTTDRYDNNTLRVIFGNAIAVKAIKEQHTNPWPDGTIFAKLALEQLIDSSGQVRPGEFKQVEFMIRDSKQYADTKGWGWARWVGMQLKPYGKDPLFVNECIGCHTPMRNNDFVFSTPLPLQLPVTTALAFNPLEWKVVCPVVDKKNKTMGTLYGNETAIQYARNNSGHAWPAGSVLALVTWQQQDDAHWFGALIRGRMQSVEVVKFGDNAPPAYELYDGDALQLNNNNNAAAIAARKDYITRQRMIVTAR